MFVFLFSISHQHSSGSNRVTNLNYLIQFKLYVFSKESFHLNSFRILIQIKEDKEKIAIFFIRYMNEKFKKKLQILFRIFFWFLVQINHSFE